MLQEEIKAKELIFKMANTYGFKFKSWRELNDSPYAKEAAKQCAIIANDENIKLLNKFGDYWVKRGEWFKDEMSELQKLKEAILKQ